MQMKDYKQWFWYLGISVQLQFKVFKKTFNGCDKMANKSQLYSSEKLFQVYFSTWKTV